ncbi:LysR family transcriptional regulator [Mycobacterium numidiamassiliense]|uniref:LysR family transcriptional regulator n=1 Tax=Mycobacterium numidiamassiliense TaxID=1841861 RepID=A0A2U3P6D7_9MYCO|nr:LysR family transcriptional regulator [Mycobacterium numidiamassiliense]SPM39317.1 LysR family transcriptional regulator [Mycobacterium numidiamassiliense]
MQQTHIGGVDLNLLPALAALLEERHVSRAATRVGLSQPAMSRALQRLRRTFDDTLLVSGRDGYTLTPRAERIRRQLAVVLPELDTLFGAQDFDPVTAQESYRLALSDYSVSAFGAALARSFRAQSPRSTLAYQLLDDTAFEDLSTGAIDLLILGRPAPAQFSSQLLFTDHFVCAVAADHKLARRRQLSVLDYLRYPHIRIDIERGGQHLIERTLGSTRNVVISTPFHALAPEMLIGTDLVLTFPARLATKFADAPDISIIEAPSQLPLLPFYSVWHPRLDNDPSRRWLREVAHAIAAS